MITTVIKRVCSSSAFPQAEHQPYIIMLTNATTSMNGEK